MRLRVEYNKAVGQAGAGWMIRVLRTGENLHYSVKGHSHGG